MKFSTALALVLAIAPACVAASQKSPESNPSERIYPVPPEYHPFDITPDASGGSISFWSAVDAKRFIFGLYSYNLNTRTITKILQGNFGWIYPSPDPHLFAVDINQPLYPESREELIVFDDTGKVRGKLPRNGARLMFFPTWSSDGKLISFDADRPGLTDESSDVDPDNFTAVGVLSIDDFMSHQFPVRPPGYSQFFTQVEGKPGICVAEVEDDNPAERKYAIYELSGHKVPMTPTLSKACICHGREYYVSGQMEVPSPFTIYSCGEHNPIRTFPAEDSKAGSLLVAHDWNPANDDLLLIEWSKGGGNFETERVGIYSVSKRKFIEVKRCSGFAWSPDGKSLILYRSGSFVVESLGP